MQPLDMEEKRRRKDEAPEPILVFIHRKVGKWTTGILVAVAAVLLIAAAYAGYRRSQARAVWEEAATVASAADLEALVSRYHGTAAAPFLEFRLGLGLYQDGLQSGDAAKLERAAGAFTTVTEDWPLSFYAPLAQLQIGYVREDQAGVAMAKPDAKAASERLSEARAAYTAAARSTDPWVANLAKEQLERLNIAENRVKHSKG
jgi:hypothetical protein